MDTTTISIKTEKKIKARAEKIATELGLSLNTVINAQLRQFIRTKRLNVGLLTENGYTIEFEEDIIKETVYAEKHSKAFNSVQELMEDLEK